ncbi:MAG: DNA recombination protein RmuC [Planctomycetes bacterium]|nr:DNA recombination protein RmuC [Planctomycetota bacterium]
MEEAMIFAAGLATGVILVLIMNFLRNRDTKAIAKEIAAETEIQKTQDLDQIIARLKESFGSLSLEVLQKNSDIFLRMANDNLSKQTQAGTHTLEEKKKLIDQTLVSIKSELEKVENLVTTFEKDREQKFGQITNQLTLTADQTRKLQEVTNKIASAIADTKVRGQWGERMAEDVLKIAAFKEGINYEKQKKLQNAEGRPDYTFFLPRNHKVNMDVKFPLNNYLNFLEAQAEADKENYKKEFLRDVRNRIKEVTTREYINPEQNTIDYVIVFIPNEQVYGFIHENDRSVLDDALKQKVILCSPITLFAVLAIIRQASENFNLERTANQILDLLRKFQTQWFAFIETMDNLGKKIEAAQKEFNSLVTTRKNQLEKHFSKIDELRKPEGIEEVTLLENNDNKTQPKLINKVEKE